MYYMTTSLFAMTSRHLYKRDVNHLQQQQSMPAAADQTMAALIQFIKALGSGVGFLRTDFTDVDCHRLALL